MRRWYEMPIFSDNVGIEQLLKKWKEERKQKHCNANDCNYIAFSIRIPTLRQLNVQYWIEQMNNNESY